MVVGSSYSTHSGCEANARAIATERFMPVECKGGRFGMAVEEASRALNIRDQEGHDTFWKLDHSVR